MNNVMNMFSIKNKLTIGFGALFFLIFIFCIITWYFIYDLSNRSEAMLYENYKSVESTKFLIQSIDEIKNQQIKLFLGKKGQFSDSNYLYHKNLFIKHYKDAEKNVTEVGEQSLINNLYQDFISYMSIFELLKSKNQIDTNLFFVELIPKFTQTRNRIIDLWELNMNAISFKNSQLERASNKAFVLTTIFGIICLFISSLFVFKFPKKIIKPLLELSSGITEIANHNYNKRLDFNRNDEFGELASAFNSMATKLNEYEHSNISELLFEKKRIETIINNMNDAIIGLNDYNMIIFSNKYACRLLGVEEESLTGKSAQYVIRQNVVFKDVLEDIFEKPENEKKDFKPLRLIFENKVKYYSREILNVKVTKTGEKNQSKAGVVVILKNITHFLEQNEAKTNFIATISHELKTPISSINLNIKLLDDNRIGYLNAEQKDIIKALKIETAKMLTITSELLNIAQVETGNILLNFEKVNIRQIFEYVKVTSSNMAKAKHISINYLIEPDLPPVWIDAEKTAWVLINLINNAIQYSEQNSYINIHSILDNQDVIIIVEDFGKGIDKQYLDLIFEKYFRVPNTGEQGTGLGLAISKEFITKQNGRIWAESMQGMGSKFYFSLPVCK